MNVLIVVAALVLAGCATTPAVAPKVVTEIRTVEKLVPVQTPCLRADEIPPHPPKVMKPDADVRGLAAGAAAELRAWEIYYGRTNALLRSCAKESK